MIKPTWPQVRCHNCGIEAHWREMVMKKEALHIQETKQDAEDQWVKWHLCVCCEAVQTGKTEAEVIDTAFGKPLEHKRIRVQGYQGGRAATMRRRMRQISPTPKTDWHCGTNNMHT